MLHLPVRIEHLFSIFKIKYPRLMITSFFQVGAYPVRQCFRVTKSHKMTHKPPEKKVQCIF